MIFYAVFLCLYDLAWIDFLCCFLMFVWFSVDWFSMLFSYVRVI